MVPSTSSFYRPGIGGLAVVIAQRTLGLCGANEMVVTGTVRDVVVGSTATFAEAGTHELKGVPGRWAIWKLTSQQR